MKKFPLCCLEFVPKVFNNYRIIFYIVHNNLAIGFSTLKAFFLEKSSICICFPIYLTFYLFFYFMTLTFHKIITVTLLVRNWHIFYIFYWHSHSIINDDIMSVYSMLVEDNVRCMGIIRGKPLAGIYIKGGGLADRGCKLLIQSAGWTCWPSSTTYTLET